MSDISLANRLLLSECNIDADGFRAGRLTPADWKELEAAAERLGKLPIYVDDRPVVSMRHIKAHSKVMQRRGRCGLILADYLQLVDPATDKKSNRNREQEIAQSSRQAKIIAKELGVPFVLSSQLARNVEGRADKTPQLSDLRESGAIEQDADIVSFIWRPAYYGMKTIEIQGHGTISTEGVGFISVAKQRDGATGTVPFRHNLSMTKITDYRSGQTSTTAPVELDGEPF
jgi:replicative DNA helicase